MKEYKVGQFWIAISVLKALAILFLAVIVPYWVFIKEAAYYKAGKVIGSISSLILLYYGITELIRLSTGLKQKIRVDENSISMGSVKLSWNEISTITFQPAVGFDPAIFIQSKDKNIEIGIPTLVGRNNLIELGRELEKKTRKFSVKINDTDGNLIDPDPPNIGMPVTLNFENSIKNMLAESYNIWLSGSLKKLDKKRQQLAETSSFEGFYKILTEKDKKLIEGFIKVHEFEADEFIITSIANTYLMTNRNIYFPTKNRAISLKDIQSYSSKGWWTITLTLILVSGEEIVIENLDGVPTEEYLDFF